MCVCGGGRTKLWWCTTRKLWFRSTRCTVYRCNDSLCSGFPSRVWFYRIQRLARAAGRFYSGVSCKIEQHGDIWVAVSEDIRWGGGRGVQRVDFPQRGIHISLRITAARRKTFIAAGVRHSAARHKKDSIFFPGNKRYMSDGGGNMPVLPLRNKRKNTAQNGSMGVRWSSPSSSLLPGRRPSALRMINLASISL